jgi:hypothetical protein
MPQALFRAVRLLSRWSTKNRARGQGSTADNLIIWGYRAAPPLAYPQRAHKSIIPVPPRFPTSGRPDHQITPTVPPKPPSRYATQSGYTTHNPAPDLRGALNPIEVQSREGITDPKKFGILMRYVDTLPTISVRNAPTPLALTAARPGELRAAEWSEIDLKQAEWVIPSVRTKMRKPHWVPLSRQAVALLTAQREISGIRSMRSSQTVCVSASVPS